MAEPTSEPWLWASAPGGGDPGRIAPNTAEILTGYKNGQAPAAGAFNWLQGEQGEWIKYLNEELIAQNAELVAQVAALNAAIEAAIELFRRALARTRVTNWTVTALGGAGELVSVAQGTIPSTSGDERVPVIAVVGGAAGASAAIYVSADGGATWTERIAAVPFNVKLFDIVFNAATNVWVMVGEDTGLGPAIYTADEPLAGALTHRQTAQATTLRTVGVDLESDSFVFIFVGAVGSAPLVWLAPHGVSSFSTPPLPAGMTTPCRAATWNGRVFVVATEDRQVITSDNGESWSQRTAFGATGGDVTYLAANPEDHTILAAVTVEATQSTQLFASFDDGDSWEDISASLLVDADDRPRVRGLGFAHGRDPP